MPLFVKIFSEDGIFAETEIFSPEETETKTDSNPKFSMELFISSALKTKLSSEPENALKVSEKIFPTAESNLTEKVPSLRDFTEISESHDESARTKNEKKIKFKNKTHFFKFVIKLPHKS